MYYVYILQSIIKDRFYVGVTQNVEVRLQKHNNGGSKSTKPYRLWTVIYWEEYRDKSAAYKREYFLKSLGGYLEKK